MMWAGQNIQNSPPEFMVGFAQWFRSQVQGLGDPSGVLHDLDRYYATAFEFVAIGAAKLESDS
jgi:hypothetical protein